LLLVCKCLFLLLFDPSSSEGRAPTYTFNPVSEVVPNEKEANECTQLFRAEHASCGPCTLTRTWHACGEVWRNDRHHFSAHGLGYRSFTFGTCVPCASNREKRVKFFVSNALLLFLLFVCEVWRHPTLDMNWAWAFRVWMFAGVHSISFGSARRILIEGTRGCRAI
jgi:hypothetical protein